MLALEPEILFNHESVEMTPDAEAEFPSVPEFPSAMAEAAFAMAEAPSAMAEASEDTTDGGAFSFGPKMVSPR